MQDYLQNLLEEFVSNVGFETVPLEPYPCITFEIYNIRSELDGNGVIKEMVGDCSINFWCRKKEDIAITNKLFCKLLEEKFISPKMSFSFEKEIRTYRAMITASKLLNLEDV